MKLFSPDGTLRAGLLAGVFFGFEFILIFWGLVYTTASRAAVFIYIAPFVVALGSRRFLGERLSALQWGGLALSFAGVALAIACRRPPSTAASSSRRHADGAARCGRSTLPVKRRRCSAPRREGAGYQIACRSRPAGGACCGNRIAHMPGPTPGLR